MIYTTINKYIFLGGFWYVVLLLIIIHGNFMFVLF